MSMDPEAAVRERYTVAAKREAPELCCPVSYNPRDALRQPRETKGIGYHATSDEAAACCGPDGC